MATDEQNRRHYRAQLKELRKEEDELMEKIIELELEKRNLEALESIKVQELVRAKDEIRRISRLL